MIYISRIFMIFACIAVVSPVLIFSGCVENNAESIKKVLTYDPSFQKLLDKKNDIQAKLSSSKADRNEKQRAIEGQIAVLKDKRSGVKADYLSSAVQLKKQIDPDRRNLYQQLLDAKNRLNDKNAELADAEKDMAEIDALVKKKDRLELTREEMQVWNKRITFLTRKKEVIVKEITDLKKDIDITKLKIKVLQIR